MRFVRMALVHGHARNTDKRYQVILPGQGHSWVSSRVSPFARCEPRITCSTVATSGPEESSVPLSLLRPTLQTRAVAQLVGGLSRRSTDDQRVKLKDVRKRVIDRLVVPI
jgi:hypothetical protein